MLFVVQDSHPGSSYEVCASQLNKYVRYASVVGVSAVTAQGYRVLLALALVLQLLSSRAVDRCRCSLQWYNHFDILLA